MAAADPRTFLREALRAVAERARRRVRPKIPSRTLRASLEVRIDEIVGTMMAVLSVPHYWAIYVHDGRGPISKQTGFLIYFRNPSDDPRLSAGFPKRAAEIRHLTKEGLRVGYRLNKAHFAAGGDPLNAPMIVIRKVGPMHGSFFFTKGMVGFLTEEAGPEITERFDRFVQQIVDSGLHERATARIRL